SIFVKYDGKFASRWRAKSPDALCAVLPKLCSVLPVEDFFHIFILYLLSYHISVNVVYNT
ncbi:MAG: hypothetical protein ACLUGC_12295, partial [Ruminococcus callidus]|uniref:hypothetical protein n=1 Tax=Ruminococcus callidus TaxID=40519 RepID=UPI003995FC9B